MVTTAFSVFVHLLMVSQRRQKKQGKGAFIKKQVFGTDRIAVNIQHIGSCPLEDLLQKELKAAYKSGEIHDGQETLITLNKIKTKLKESEIFNWEDPDFTDREKKEMNKLFDAVEIMVSSRNRQPSSVQNMFSSLRLVERVVKKQLKQGQISEALASKFNWDKLSNRQRREKPTFTLDKMTNMRIFNLH